MITHKAPCSIMGEISAERRFLAFNDVEIDEKKFSAKVMMPKIYVVTQDRIPTQNQLATMFNVATPKGRVILILGVYGLGIGEMVNLKVGDLKFNKEVPHLLV